MARYRVKVWLDDVRDAPPGWVRAFTPEEVIGLLQLRDRALDRPLPEISVHSGNPVGRDRMLRVIRTIHRLHATGGRREPRAGRSGHVFAGSTRGGR